MSRSIQMPLQIVCRIPLFIFCMDPMFFANHLPSPSEFFDLEYDMLMWDSPCVSKILVKFREWVVCCGGAQGQDTGANNNKVL